MKIAFIDKDAKIYEIQDVVLKNTGQTKFQLPQKKPVAIVLNYFDEAYIKVRLDPISVSFFKQNLSRVDDELTRAIVWRALWDMLRDGQLPSIDFVEIVAGALSQEKSDSILSNILAFTEGAIRIFTPQKLRSLLYYRVFDSLYHSLVDLDITNINRVVLLRNWLIFTADDPRHVQIVLDWFNGKHKSLSKIELGLKDKWSIVRLAFREKNLSKAEKEEYFNEVAKIDSSDVQKSVRKTCDALLVEGESRQQLWNSYFDPEIRESVHSMGDSMRGFNDDSRLEELKEYHNQFFEKIIEVFETRTREYSRTFYRSLFPSGDNLEQQLASVQKVLDKCPAEQTSLKKMLRESADDLRRRNRAFGTLFDSIKQH